MGTLRFEKRKKPYVDIALTEHELQRITAKKSVHKKCNGTYFAIYLQSMSPAERKIHELEQALAEAKKNLHAARIYMGTTALGNKKSYVKRNMAYWEQKAKDMRKNSPLFRQHNPVVNK